MRGSSSPCSRSQLRLRSTPWRSPIGVPIEERSKSSVVVPTYQPRFTSPMTFRAGTRTSSKNTSLKSCPPVMFTSGRTVMPGVFMSSRK